MDSDNKLKKEMVKLVFSVSYDTLRHPKPIEQGGGPAPASSSLSGGDM